MEFGEIIKKAVQMRGAAYAPYSRFTVGAAVLADSGRIYGGANVENATYGATVCAERNAIYAAVMAGARKILAIAICGGREGSSNDYCPPCGICRQVMREFCCPDEMNVVVAKSIDDFKVFKLSELLPESFGPEVLR